MKKALILGASGLIGYNLLECLLCDEEYEEVRILVRGRMEADHPKLKQLVLDDFYKMGEFPEYFQVDDIFCCLGTTMKKAKLKENFKKVDFDFPLLAGEMAKEARAKRYLLVSAMGANERSLFFYNRVKGEVERAIQQLMLPSFLIFRPSLLLGQRKEFRWGEKAAGWISQPLTFLFGGPLLKYRPVQARDVAIVMHRMAQSYLPGTHIFENDQIHKIMANYK